MKTNMAAEYSGTQVRKGANKHCCWGNCKNDSRYPDKFPPGTYFIPFPKVGKIKESMTQWEKNRQSERTEKAKQWIHACGRKAFGIKNITKDTYICSNHFVGNSGPTEDNPNPLLATLTEEEMNKRLSRKRKQPSLRLREPLNPSKKNKKNAATNIQPDAISDQGSKITSSEDADTPVVETFKDTTGTNTDPIILVKPNVDVATQTEADKLAVAGRIDNIILKNQISLLKTEQNLLTAQQSANPMDVNVILKSEKKTKYFIGLIPKHFLDLYNFLGDAKFQLNYWNSNSNNNGSSMRKSSLSISQQLFISLMRLRRGFNIFTLSHFYGVSETTIRTIFTTWIMFLFHHFKTIKFKFFPERQAFRKNLPKVFKPFKNIRASIDCTEFKCETPRDYKQQGNLYSSYKSHCTMKCLIAVNPNGAACFVSDLYEGSISDINIFEQCGILQHVNYKDSFLVDKGFTVQHLLLRKQATIFIPPFLGKREKFTKEEVILTKRIAKARIHVERFNERLKKFRLLDRIIPLSLVPMASQLVFVGSMLVNFQEFLCK